MNKINLNKVNFHYNGHKHQYKIFSLNKIPTIQFTHEFNMSENTIHLAVSNLTYFYFKNMKNNLSTIIKNNFNTDN